VPAHRAVTVQARPAAAAAAAAAGPPLDLAQLAHGDTLSERDLGAAPRTARGSTSPSLLSTAGGARYETHGELGRGGMGRVLEALDRRLGRVVAIKESFATDPDGQQRFEREVSITARLEHPSIVPLYDSGITEDGRAFYVMRKLSGRGLDLVMSELTSLDERLALLPSLLAACDAVAHAHARRVVHRDLKPGNILIGDHGETLVIDWGLAKAIGESDAPPGRRAATAPAEPSLPHHPPSAPVPIPGAGPGSRPAQAPLPPDDLKTIVGSVFGTPGFMSPEQARGEQLDMRGDVYALGATLYHLLAGRPPHIGKSATEVIDRVRVEPPPPLVQVCPGAPVELAAIVEKAMAFDIDARYPEAAALAGDLRRFLAGQLVAAHRYTSWQRLRRAARTHRAAFLVAGASLLVVSALAAVSVLRILAERDQAHRARLIAVHETSIAKAARDEAAARADELVVAQAQGLVEQNPTAAIGLLKRLPPASPAWPKARMVALGAIAQGVTRGVADGARRPPSIFAMSPRADLLLVGDEHGKVWTLELETLRRQEIWNAGPGDRPLGCWVNGGATLALATEATGLSLRDLDTGRVRPVPLPHPVMAIACHPTGQAALLDKTGALWFLDPALGQTRPVDTGVAAELLELSPDGTHLAIGGDQEAVLLDRDGAVRRRLAGETIRITTSAKGRFGFFMRDRVVEIDPASAAAPREIALTNKLALSLYFIGEHLRILYAANRLTSGDGVIDVDLPSTPIGFAALGDRTTALGLNDGSVWLSGWWGSRILHTPTNEPILRLSARPGGARLAGWSRGTIMVWNLGGAIPRSLPADRSVSRVLFLGEDRLAAIGNSSWRWLDLERGTEDLVEQSDLPLFNDIVVDVDDGNALLIDTMMGRASLMSWADKRVVGTWRDRVRCATLLGRGDLAVGTTDGRVAVGDPTAGPLKILRMESAVIAVNRFGEHGVVALDAEGELLTYDLSSGTLTRGSLGEPASGIIVDDGDGAVIAAIADRLVRWTPKGVEELARFGEPINRVTRYQRHLAILTDTELSTIDLRNDNPHGTFTVRRIAGASREQQLRDGSRWSIGIGQRGLIDLVDIATGMRWAKSIHGGLAMYAVSPSGARVAQLLRSEIALWSYPVPEEPGQLRAWLDETTNATVSEALDVIWSPPPPPLPAP
jgi:serine/threonine protein kinase